MEEKINVESFIEEMAKVQPEVLTPEAKKLFDTIMQILDENLLLKESLKDKCDIADERNQLLIDKQKLNKVIDEMSKFMSYDYCIPTVREECKIGEATPKECASCIKQYFIKKVEEQE